MKSLGQLTSYKSITVGVKILIGVTIASNLFIGLLLYINLKSSETIAHKVGEVFTIREELSRNLRAAVVNLQNEFLILPDFFRTNPTTQIIENIVGDFPVEETQVLKGRAEYSKYFGRKERRDLVQNRVVAQVNNGQLYLSRGIFNDQTSFTDSVERMVLASNDPEGDLVKLENLIETLSTEVSNSNTLQKKVSELGTKVADIGLMAEKTRNEVLDHVESINQMERELEAFRANQKRYTLGAAGIAILANMMVLFVLVRWIVEKPLHNLTHTIDEIRSGKSPEVPYGERTDQIGVLSGAISNFREALSEIKNENERKEREKIIIDEMFANIASVVNTLEYRSRELVTTANLLEQLAVSSEIQSESVHQQATATAEHTNRVSDSTVRLQLAFQAINEQITTQNAIVGNILGRNTKSREHIDSLNLSIRDIRAIIATVSEITDQTKLLALNATIEAARAGNAGKGFGVVASEVKALSLKTESATGDVMSRVKAIEKASAVLVSNLQEIDQEVQELNQLTSNIIEAVYMQQSETVSIADLAGQTAKNTQSVSTSICEVSKGATETRGLAGQVHSFSNEIANQLSKLLEDTSSRLAQLTEHTTHFSDLKN